MSDSSNKLSQFWEELKRRNVHRSVAIYAGSAFVILEAATIIFPRWGFPDWTIDLVLYLLILGVFIIFIVSWIFDITTQGVQKTKPLEEITETEKSADSKVWKAATYISLVIIVALIILNIVPVGKTIKTGDIQSLVILPFENYTGDDLLDISISGMHSMLINDVGRISEIRIISKTTANVYKDVDMTIPQIASEQNVDALVEIGVLCMGDTICFQLKVVTPDEKQLWITEYRVEKGQILNLNNKITRQIADEIMVELTPEEERLLDRDRTVDREAYDAYLRGYSYAEDLSHESLIKARDYLNSAIEKDPDWAPLYAAMSTVWLSIGSMGVESPEIAVPIVYEYLNKGLELDPDLTDAHYVSAFMALTAEWDWEKAEKEFLKALAINPNHVFSRIHYSHMLYMLQRPDEAQMQADLAYRLDPMNPLIQSTYALTLLCENDCASALSVVEKVLASDPDNFLANNVVDAAAFQCGDLDRVFEAEKHKRPLEADIMNEIEKIYNKNGFHAAYEEIMHHLELLAKKIYVTPADMALKYYMINQDEKAMDWIEKGAEERDPSTLYIGTGYFNFTRLYDNQRFIKVLEKMNLPLPKD